jgi:hypothetical protein
MADIECICDRDDCRQCWLRTMDDTAEIIVEPVVPDAIHDTADVPLVVRVPHGYEEPCS